jgi:hypothetical protein
VIASTKAELNSQCVFEAGDYLTVQHKNELDLAV